MVTSEQLYMAIGIPMLFNLAVIGFVVAYFNARFDKIESRRDSMEIRFDKRFDDMRDLWRAELRRVEEMLDARLKHIEERM